MAGDRPLGDMVIGLSMDGTQFSNTLNGIRGQIRQAQSAMRANLRVLGDAGSEYERLSTRVRGLNESMAANQRQIEILRQRHQEAIRVYGEGSDQASRYATQLNNAVDRQAAWQRQLQQTQDRLSSLDRPGAQFSRRLSEISDRARAAGNKMKEIGNAISDTAGKMTLALGAGLGLAAKSAADFEAQMSSAESVMDPAEAKKYDKALNDLAITMGSKTKYSATQAAQGIEELVKAGVSVTDIINGGLSGSLDLATAGDLELKDAAEIASTALNAFRKDNLSVAKAANILAGAANASATDVSELKFGLSAVSAVASGVGLNFKDTATALAAFAQNGLKGQDAGTSLKTMLLNLSPHTKAAADMMDQLGLATSNTTAAYNWLMDRGIKPASKSTDDVAKALEKLAKIQAGSGASAAKIAKEYDTLAQYSGFASSAFYDVNGNLKSMDQIAGLLQNSLKGLNSEQRQNALNTMFGTDAIRAGNILYKEGAKGIKGMAAAMDKVKAADVAKKKMDNFKGAVEQLKGSLETAGISIGNALLPALKTVTSWVQRFVDWFNNLSPSMQHFIAIGGLVTTVLFGIGTTIGVLLAGIGGFITAIGTISGSLAGAGGLAAAASGATGALAGGGGLAAALSAITGPIGWTIAAVAAAGVAMYKFDQAMDKPIIKSQIFSDNISKATKKAVGSYLNLDEKATESLNKLAWSNETITKSMADKLVGIYNDMNAKILASMDKRHAQEKEKAQGIFADNNALSTAEEAKILAKMDKDYSSKKKKEQNYQKQITNIINTAKNQHRGLTEQERIEIASIQNKMRTTAVKTMSKSEAEQKMILGRLKNESGIISAEQAAKVVASSKKQRDETVKNAKKQYKDTRKQIEYMRDVLGVISADQAKKMIAKAKEQRTKTIDNANLMHDKVILSAKKQAGAHVDQVDWETGKVLTGWQNMYNGVIKAVNWIRNIFGLKDLPLKGSVKLKSTSKAPSFSQTHYGGGHQVSSYAIGTKNGTHLGGPAIVGEEGPELGYIPGMGLTLFGRNGSEFISNLPKGSSILPNKYTENLLKSYGFPGYAGGIGDYFKTIMKGPKALWNLAVSKIGIKNSLLPSWMAKWADFPSIIGNWGKNFLKGLIDKFFGKGATTAKDITSWTPYVIQALAMNGLSTAAGMVKKVLRQIATESGGNPNAIQKISDINSKNGNPAMGLMQTIKSTFDAYKFSGHGNIFNGFDNLLAALNYAKHRYGPNLSALGKGHGYANGGLVFNEQLASIAEGNKPEAIIPLDPLKRTRAMQILSRVQNILGVPQGEPAVVSNNNSAIIARQDQQISLMQQQINLLTRLLLKDNNVYIGSKDIYNANKKEQDKQNSLRNMFKGVKAFG